MSISIYEFEMISDPECISLHSEDWQDGDKTGVPIRQYSKILFKDSLFNFFPYAEIYFKDSAGQIIDHVFFLEGLKFNCKLGFIKTDEQLTPEDKALQQRGEYKDYLEHSYIWSEHEINNIHPSSSISGDNVFIMISEHFYKDYPQSKTFNHENSSTKQTISDILKNKVLPELGISKDKYKNTISTTTGTPYLNQYDITNKEFITKLSEYAYSQNYPTSGFYTFINCNGEFYFMTINELMAQKPVFKYKLDLTENMMTEDKYIKDFRIRFGGVPINFENYKRKVYSYKSNSTSSNEEKNIHNILTDYNSKTKFLIHKDNIPTKQNTKISYTGIQQGLNNTDFYKGQVNYFYRDSSMSYREHLVVAFNPNCVSGKTIEVEVEKQTKDDEISAEISGNWLICESYHMMDNNGIPYSQLVVSKPKIQVSNDNPFINYFKA